MKMTDSYQVRRDRDSCAFLQNNVFIPITGEQVPMERQQLIQLGISLVIGIIIGTIIGFTLWHGASGTCAAPLNLVN
jgi:hypothetical protein